MPLAKLVADSPNADYRRARWRNPTTVIYVFKGRFWHRNVTPAIAYCLTVEDLTADDWEIAADV